LFIYTLPNIAAGEIAIRHGWQTETSFYVLRNRNEKLMRQIIQATLSDPHRGNIPLVSGWVDNEKEKLKIYGQTD
jgi:3-oxoacyl-[acyl-carrier-protein] synthase-1